MVRLIFIAIILAFVQTSVLGQSIYVIRDKTLFGAVDSTGKTILPVEYEMIMPEGTYPFYYLKKNGRFGAANDKGEILVSCQYDEVMALGTTILLLNECGISKWYSTVSKEIKAFTNLKKTVRLSAKLQALYLDTALVLLNKATGEFVPVAYDSIAYPIDPSKYSQQTSIFEFMKDGQFYPIFKKWKKGLINEDLRQIVPARFNSIEYVDNNWLADDGFYNALYNSEGEIIIPPDKYKQIRTLAPGFYQATEKNDGVFNRRGKQILPCEFNRIKFKTDVFEAVKNNKLGLFDLDGQTIVPASWDLIEKLRSDCYLVGRKSTFNLYYGLVKRGGAILTNPIYDYIRQLGDDYFSLEKNEKITVIDYSGKVYFQGNFQEIEFLSDINSFLIKGGDSTAYNYGIVNAFGQTLLDTIYLKSDIKTKPFEINVIKDTCLISLTLDNRGKLIEKIVYKNFIRANVDTANYNHWIEKRPDEKTEAWVLVNGEERPIIPVYFKSIEKNFAKKNKLTKAKTMDGYFTIVNDTKGRIVLDSLWDIDETTLNQNRNTICLKNNRKFYLITPELKRVSREYRFIGLFVNGLARVNDKGTLNSNNEGFALGASQFRNLNVTLKGYTFCKGGKWGLIDTTGNLAIGCSYDYLETENKGKIIAIVNSRYGVIDRSDKILIPFNYNEIRFFPINLQNDSAKFPCLYYKARKGKNWGVINEANKTIVPFEYQNVEYLPNEKGDFFVATKNNKKGLLDTAKRVIIPFNFDEIEYLDATSKSLFRVRLTSNKANGVVYPLTGFMDKRFEFNVLPQFYDAWPFENGFARVCFYPKKFNFIRPNGEMLCRDTLEAAKDFRYGKAAVSKNGKWGYMDTTANFVLPCKYGKANNFYGNVAVVGTTLPPKFFNLIRKKKITALINSSGEIIKKLPFKDVEDFKDGMAVVSLKRQQGLIDTLGRTVLPVRYTELRFEGHNLLIAWQRGENTTVFSVNGTTFKVLGKYDLVGPFSEGFAWVRKGKKYGFIDSTGNLAVNMDYDFAGNFSNGCARIGNNGLFGFTDNKGRHNGLLYKECEDFKNGYSRVRLDKDYFYINTNHNTSKPPAFVKYKLNGYDGKRGIYCENNKYWLVDSNMTKYNSLPFAGLHTSGNGFYIKKNFAKTNNTSICDEYTNQITGEYFEKILPYTQNFAVIKTTKLEGLYNSRGEYLIPTQYLEVLKESPNVVKLLKPSRTIYYNLLSRKIIGN
jgi:hypothetical protein